MANNTTTSALTDAEIQRAMISSVEDFVFSVIDSIEWQLQRKLTDAEIRRVGSTVSRTIEGNANGE